MAKGSVHRAPNWISRSTKRWDLDNSWSLIRDPKKHAGSQNTEMAKHCGGMWKTLHLNKCKNSQFKLILGIVGTRWLKQSRYPRRLWSDAGNNFVQRLPQHRKDLRRRQEGLASIRDRIHKEGDRERRHGCGTHQARSRRTSQHVSARI